MKKLIVEDIEIELTKKNIKNINLSIQAPNGIVKISAPKSMNEENIKLFIESKIPWIRKQLLRFDYQNKIPDNKYESGEGLYYFGKLYLLNVIYLNINRSSVEICNNKYIYLYVQEGSSKEKKERIIKEWYREELKVAILPLIVKWERLFDVKVESWGVKQMKTRWGSCNTRDKRIWINLELAKKSPQCLEYIVVHEIAHFMERGHGDKFKAIMDRYYPNWRSVKAELNGMVYKKRRV